MTLNLVRKAKQGDKDSLLAVIPSIQGRLCGLPIRMLLWHPADAEDATQEILAQNQTGVNYAYFSLRESSWIEYGQVPDFFLGGLRGHFRNS